MKRLAACVILLLSAAPVYAYVDPGTGAALFSGVSAVLGLLYAGASALQALIRGLPGFALRARGRGAARGPGAARRDAEIAVYSEGAQYANVLVPIVRALADRGARCRYLASDPSDPGLSLGLLPVDAEPVGSGSRAYLSLNMLQAGVCVMTTPQLDASPLRRSRSVRHYVHVLHAPYDATLYRLFGLDAFDTVLLGAPFQAAALRELEALRGTRAKNLVPVGCTYLDVLADRRRRLPGRPQDGGPPTVLVAPSWGENGLLRRHGMSLLEPLARSGLRILIRPHPQSWVAERRLLERLAAELPGPPRVEWDRSPDNLEALSRADLLVSDFSGVIFDYCFLFGRPVLRMPLDLDLRYYDAGELPGEPWAYQALRRITSEITPSQFPRAGALVRAAISRGAPAQEIEAVRREAYPWPGQAAARAAEELIRIRDSLRA